MTRRARTLVMGLFLLASPVLAQQKNVTGKVTSETGSPMAEVQVVIKGTNSSIATNDEGNYLIRASQGQVLQFRFIGTAPIERTVGAGDVINVQLRRVAANLDRKSV